MVESERVQVVESTHRYSHSTAERLRAQTAAARAGAHVGNSAPSPLTRPPLRSTPPSMIVDRQAGRHPSPAPWSPASDDQAHAGASPGPWHSVVRRCAILSRESDAVLTTDEDGSLTLLAAENALAVVIGMVGGAGPVVDVVLDWGDRAHPTEVLRFQPSAAELARIFPTLSADSAVAMFARGLAGAGALTSPAADEFPGPPWAQYADTAALERAWRAAAERGTP